MRRSSRRFLVLACAALLPAPVVRSQEYRVIEIEPLGGATSDARGVGDLGVATGAANISSGQSHAFLWSEEGLLDLGTLGGIESFGNDADASNRVVGWSNPGTGIPGHAFLWDDGVMSDLGTLGGNRSTAYAINEVGQIAGESNDASSLTRAFLWEGGVMVDLGTLGGPESKASALNDAGVVVGSAELPGGAGPHACLFVDGGVVDLGTLGGTRSDAFGINEAGDVVGVSRLAGDVEQRAFLWRDGGMEGLGTLGGNGSEAFGINNSGEIVGISKTSSGAWRAFVWRGGEMINLNKLIPEGTGWELDAAVAINSDGWITGYGYKDHVYRGFVLVPERCQLRAGAVNTGDGSEPADVFAVDGKTGNSCGEVSVEAGFSIPIDVFNAPSVPGKGQYGLWLLDGAPSIGDVTSIYLLAGNGTVYNLGLGCRCLPVNNLVFPDTCPCPVEFPEGWTSKNLGASTAAKVCLNRRPGYPRSPTRFFQAFPAADYTLGGVVLDRNSIHSPEKDVSIANWIVVRAR